MAATPISRVSEYRHERNSQESCPPQQVRAPRAACLLQFEELPSGASTRRTLPSFVEFKLSSLAGFSKDPMSQTDATADAAVARAQHEELIHSVDRKVLSHVQREDGEWFLNTVLIEGTDVPFRYRRKKQYKSLKGARVNITYYPVTEIVAGIEVETMKVVRILRS